MPSSNLAIFTKEYSNLRYTMGLDFFQSSQNSGFQHVENIPYYHLIETYGLSFALDEIRRIILERSITIVFFPLDSSFDLPLSFLVDLRKICYVILHVADDSHYFTRSSIYYGQCADLVLVADSPYHAKRFQMGINSQFFPHILIIQTSKI